MPSHANLPPTRAAMSDFLKGALGGDAQVAAYYDEGEGNVLAVVEASGTPQAELTTFASASLHGSPNFLEDRDIRVELLMVATSDAKETANVVATSAFYLMKNGWLAAPGVVFPNALGEYFPATTVPHVLWTEPFDFEGLGTVSVEGVGMDVHLLQGVPLSGAEAEFLTASGIDALEERLASAKVLHYDFQRESVC